MENKIISVVIGAFVTITLLAMILIPVLNDAQTETNSTAMNTTEKFLMADFKDSDSILIEYTGDNTLSVNGETYTVTSSYFTVGFSDKAVIRLQTSTMTVMDSEGTVTSNVKSIAYENGTATLTKTDDTEVTASWQYLFYPSSVGTWGFFQDAGSVEEDVYIDNNKTAYVVSWTSWNTGTNSSVYGMWEINNGVATNVIPAHYQTTYGGSFTADDDAAIDLHYTDSADGLTKYYTGATFTIGGTDYSDQAYIIAPLEYHYKSTTDNGIIALYGAIPVLVIVAIVLGVVSIYRKN